MIKQITIVKFECFIDRPVSTCTLFNIGSASLTLKLWVFYGSEVLP